MGAAGWWSKAQHERRVVPIEDPEDLAADVLVRVSVVAHVEVGEARLVEGGLRALVAPEPLQERAGLRVGVPVEEGGEDVDGLARAVLADERVGQAAGRLRVGRGAGQEVARRALRGSPVARLEPEAEERLGAAGAGRRHDPRPFEERGRGVVAPSLPVAVGGADQHALQQVPRGHGVATEEVLGRAHVLRGERRPRLQAIREAGRGLPVGVGGARRAQGGVRDLGRRRDRRRRRRPREAARSTRRGRRPERARGPSAPRVSRRAVPGRDAGGPRRRPRRARGRGRGGRGPARRPGEGLRGGTPCAGPARRGPSRGSPRSGGTRESRPRSRRSGDSPWGVPWPARDGAPILAG